MENLKVKVNSEAESKEVQELFFELGGAWDHCGNNLANLDAGYFCVDDGEIICTDEIEIFFNFNGKEITIQQLKDLVILKRNDVNDATHVNLVTGSKVLQQGDKNYYWQLGEWHLYPCGVDIKPIEKKEINGTEYLMQGKNGERLMESVGQLKDNVNQPNHYTSGGIECLDAMQAMLSRDEFIGFLRGNVFKYNWRYKLKNGIEDLKKAQFYQNKLIKLESDDAI